MIATASRGLRAVALVLALSFAFASGLLFTTQTGAYAYQAGAAKAVKLFPSVAKGIVSVSPWGRTALTALQVASLFGVNPGGLLPGFTTGNSPNSDQPAGMGSGASWNFPSTQYPSKGTLTYAPGTDAGGNPYTHTYSITSLGGYGTVLLYTLDSAGKLYGQYGSLAVDGTGNTATGTITPNSSPNGHALCAYPFGSQANCVYFTGTSASTPTGDPQRRYRSYSDCAASVGGTTVRAYASWTAYKESEGLPTIVPPACPVTSPHRVGFGADYETLSSGGVWGGRQPLVPPLQRPAIPAAYPNATPDDGLTANPQPQPGPQVAPDGTTVAEPQPDSQGNYCWYGPYNVPPENCNDPEVPVPGPTTAPAPTPAPSPDPNGYPRPTPEPVPVEGQGCMGEGVTLNPVTWVFTPVKCALKWAFEISPETRTKWSEAGALAKDKPPVSLVNGMSGFAAPFGSLGMTCPNWTVKVSTLQQNVVCGQGYTERLHDWRDLTGAALLALAVMPFLWRVWHAGIPVLNVQPHR